MCIRSGSFAKLLRRIDLFTIFFMSQCTVYKLLPVRLWLVPVIAEVVGSGEEAVPPPQEKNKGLVVMVSASYSSEVVGCGRGV